MVEFALEGPYVFSLLFGILVIVLGFVKFFEILQQYSPQRASPILNKINYWMVGAFSIGMALSGVFLILQPWESLFLTPETSFLEMSKVIFHISFYPLIILAVIFLARIFFKKNRNNNQQNVP
jgi:hypothetical protein